MTGSSTRCWRSGLSADDSETAGAGAAGPERHGSLHRLCGRLLPLVLVLWLGQALAGSIEPVRAGLSLGDDGYTLSAEFNIDLGPRLEEAVTRGVVLNFNLEFTLSRNRWYWIDEHVAGHIVRYRLSYSALTRQFRVSVGALHQSYASLQEALRFISRVGALPVADKAAIKPGATYEAALRLSLDKSLLPKPFQVDAIANRDWQVDATILRWDFTPTGEGR